MSTRVIYCDESGFTGYNLLDPNQPVFAIASANLDDKRAEEILRESFPNYREFEFKFSNIWRTKHKLGLFKFADNLNNLRDLSFVYVIDKRFAVLSKIVDFLIEPHITDAGYDFYEDGFCWKYCNYIYFEMTQFSPPELLDSQLNQYQAFSRNPTTKALDRLQTQLNIMALNAEQSIQNFIEQMELGARLFHKYYTLDRFKGSDELQLTTMFAIVVYWRQRFLPIRLSPTPTICSVSPWTAGKGRRRRIEEAIRLILDCSENRTGV